MQPQRQFLPHLPHIPPQHLRLLPIPWRLKRLVQRKARLARQTELLQTQIDEELLGGARIGVALRGEFCEAVGEEEDAVDEQPVGGALDLEVAEEGVGAEEGENFVEDVVRFGVRVDVEGGGGGGEDREREGGTAGFGAKGEEGKVACGFGCECNVGRGKQGGEAGCAPINWTPVSPRKMEW